MNKKTKKANNILDEITDYLERYFKKLNENPIEVINSWGFRFFFGAVFYLIFPNWLIGLLLISIIYESSRYFILLKNNPLIYEGVIDKVVLILLSLAGFSLMKILL